MKQPDITIIGLGAPHTGVRVVMELLATHPEVVDDFPVTTVFTDHNFSRERVTALATSLERESAGQRRGIVAPAAFTYHAAPERIARTVPNAKLIVVVRNPLERLVVAYREAKRRGLVPHGERCAAYAARHRALQSDGMYGQWLAYFAPYYASTQLQVVVYEDLRDRPLETMQSLFTFLEINTQFIPPALAHYAPPPDEPKRRSLLRRGIRFIYQRITKLFTATPQAVVPPPLTLETYLTPDELALYRRVYAADVAHLSFVLHRDMSVVWGFAADPESTTIA